MSDWGKKVGASVSAAVVLAVIWWIQGSVASHVADFNEVKSAIQQHDESIARLASAAVEQSSINQQMKGVSRMMLTKRGRAKILSSGDELQAATNIVSASYIYSQLGIRAIRVTNLSHPDSPSVKLNLEGRFNNRAENYLINISKKGGQSLLVNGGDWIDIRIEPVE
jgi:hypothetical protein